MVYAVKILADSISRAGRRVITVEATYPRMVHSELMTHRQFSRNSASSRAIPIDTMLERVRVDPVIPVWWGKNQKGMQATVEMDASETSVAKEQWLSARDAAVAQAEKLRDAGLHKQLVNRVVEPWMWITVIVSSTEWKNFFSLRCHPDAQPEIRVIAEMIRDAVGASTSLFVGNHGWHLPLVPDRKELVNAGFTIDEICRISIGRCARVSYLTHHGERDPQADLQLCDRLQHARPGHFSPFEHVAQPLENADEPCGNFRGWRQYRKLIAGERGE